ncbi:hypothetical protein [Clostridium sp. JN-9]|uniref:hypothetical protein n=1 Tax=Clostridium sp. JN-9 TaxID=2507159 RepID=UPI000FFE118D|nr:hypothetical protein [Clostridium sp. JN-9]QAT39417.1 hypothetical protein EQM05_03680 [Clostridium sp. JN-9]
MKTKKFLSKIALVLIFLIPFTFSGKFNGKVHAAAVKSSIISPQVVLHPEAFTYTYWTGSTSNIYAYPLGRSFYLGKLIINAQVSTTELWNVDEYGNKYSMISSKNKVIRANYSLDSTANSVTEISEGISADGSYYSVKLNFSYNYKSANYTHIQTFYFYA